MGVQELLLVRAVGCAQQGSASALSPHPAAPRLLASTQHQKGKLVLGKEGAQEIKTAGKCLFRAERFTWGALLQLLGVGRPCIIPHLREKPYSTDVIGCFFFLTSHTSAEPHGLRRCKPAKIIVFFHSRYEEKTHNNGYLNNYNQDLHFTVNCLEMEISDDF